MKFDLKNLPQSEIELMVELDPKEWGEFINEAVKELSREIKVEGFRPGHAPRAILEQRIGMGRILEKAADRAVKKTYIEIIKENKIEAISRPIIQIIKAAPDNPFEFKAKIAVVPELPPFDYRSIASSENQQPKKEIKVSEEELENALGWLQKSRTKFITVTREAKKGDRVEVDFTAKKGGQVIEGGMSKNHPILLGEGHFVPGFEDNLLNLKEGEEKKFNLVFPADYTSRELAGQPIDFEVKMNLVQAAEAPALNDDFAKSLGAFNDLAALKKNISDGLKQEKETKAREALRVKLLEEITGKISVELPAVLIEAELEKMTHELKESVAQMGLEFNAYLANIKKTEAELKKDWADKARKRVCAALVLREIAKKEKIEVSAKEIEEEAGKMLAHYPDIKSVEKQIDIERLKEYTEGKLKNEKVFQFLEKL